MKSFFKKEARRGCTSTVPEVGSRGRKTTYKIKTSTVYMVSSRLPMMISVKAGLLLTENSASWSQAWATNSGT